jgi:type IV secretion system protein VirB9
VRTAAPKPLWALLTVASAACAPPSSAQQAPVPSGDDSRIAILRYASGTTAQLHANAGIELTVLMPRGEHVQQVTVSDPGAVRVEVPGQHDGIVLAALHALEGVSLSVETERQAYQFNFSVSYQGLVPWLVRIERGSAPVRGGMFPTVPISTGPAPSPLPPGAWKLKGDKALMPSMIRDDGMKVIMQWSITQAIPAVFALDDRGQEQMVNGYMRGDTFVIDRVYDHLVFRIDKASAHADRGIPKPNK